MDIKARHNSGLMENRYNGKHEQGTHSTKMDVYKSFENSQNAPKFIFQIVCQSPKVWDFDEIKASFVLGFSNFSGQNFAAESKLFQEFHQKNS